MWLSYFGSKKTAYSGAEFPYTALSISSNSYYEFKSIDDIYKELEALYDIAIQKGFPIGQSLYNQGIFFADISLLVCEKMQRRIKEYLYCTKFTTSLYPTMQETPAIIVDDFLAISEEQKYCEKHENELNQSNKEK